MEKRNTVKKLLIYLKGYEKECVLAPAFKMLEALMDLMVPLVVAGIIDTGIAAGSGTYVIHRFLLLLLLAALGLGFSFTAQYFAAKASVGFAARIRQAMFDHVQSLSYQSLDRIGTDTLINRMTNDVQQTQNGLNIFLRLTLRSPFIVFGSMICAFRIDAKAAIVFAVAIPVLGLVVYGIMIASIPLFGKVQRRLDSVLEATRENLTGVRVIRAFCREETQVRNFDEKNEAFTKLNEKVGRLSAAMNPATYALINIATIVLIYVGAIRVDRGVLTQGSVVALYNYMAQMIVELIKLASVIITINKSLACARRVQEVLDLEPGMTFPEESTSRGDRQDRETGEPSAADGTPAAAQKAGAGEPSAADGTPAAAQKAGAGEPSAADGTPAAAQKAVEGEPSAAVEIPAVRFRGVSFAYAGAGEDAISGISFMAKKGETIGIIGGTGSGKSTLASLIPRFYDATGGKVEIDGRDIRSYPEEELIRRVSVVPQKAVLFKGTIRSNLLWGCESASEDDLREAMETAQAMDVAEKKAGGLDAEVEQNGRNFSGGQRQRLTIARALVSKPEILILDDSASALDFATDAKLRRAIRHMEGERTVFLISQRCSTVMQADKILVLEDGKLAGCGSHDQLLKDCGVYQEIYYSQFPEKRPEAEAPMTGADMTGPEAPLTGAGMPGAEAGDPPFSADMTGKEADA